MKKLIIGFLALGLFASTGLAVQLGQGLGDYFSTGISVDGGIVGSVESYCIDVQQYTNVGIVTGNTDDLVFPFVPSKIVLEWDSYILHTVGQVGMMHGSSIVTIIGTDAMTTDSLMSIGTIITNATLIQQKLDAQTTNIINAYGGDNGVTSSSVTGLGTWTTATKTLTITYTASNTTTASTIIACRATAYR